MKRNYLWVVEIKWPKEKWKASKRVFLTREDGREDMKLLEGLTTRLRKYRSNEAT